MKRFSIFTLLVLCAISAYCSIEVKNADGVTINYNYINNGTELEVTNFHLYKDENVINIPETVTYMNRTRRVTSIGEQAFAGCSRLTSVSIPNSVTSIGEQAFAGCSRLTSVPIPNSVSSIGKGAFYMCRHLTSVNIPNSVISIGDRAFSGCSGLTSVTISNSVTFIGYKVFEECSSLTSVTVPNSVNSIGEEAFKGCRSLTSVSIPKSVSSIGKGAFYMCKGLTSVNIPYSVITIGNTAFALCDSLTSVTISNGVTSIGVGAFWGCDSLTSITIPNSVTSIGEEAFYGCNIHTIVSLIENPFKITGKEIAYSTFSHDTFNNATLYVPVGTIDKYKATEGWKDFLFIEEGTGESGPTTPQKCEKPTISYQNGKLTFNCETEGTTCQSTITNTDITSYSSNEIQLGVTYNISVYATKAGNENSDIVKATLCWIDAEPKTEGIENSIAQVRANAVLIQSNEGTLTISGLEEGTLVNVYTVSGQLVATNKTIGLECRFFTNLKHGDLAIVKIGDRSVKIIMQ